MIPTIEELKQDYYGTYSDASKEVYGVRLRRDVSEMSIEEVMEMTLKMCDRASEEAERYYNEAIQNQADFEKEISHMISLGAKGYIDAIRWIIDAENLDMTWGPEWAAEEFIVCRRNFPESYGHNLENLIVGILNGDY